jgi:hypothetical protein
VSGPATTVKRDIALNLEPFGTYKLGNGLSQWLEGKGFIANVYFTRTTVRLMMTSRLASHFIADSWLGVLVAAI